MIRARWTALALAALGLTAPAAWAGTATRAWVSGHGTDTASCGSPAAPCRSLQYAHDNIVGAGAEIDILDPAGYGAITITKAVSIVNDGVGTAGVQASGGNNGITVSAGASDGVYLRGLNIDGVQNTGHAGIQFNAGASLTVVNCVVRHFNGPGIAVIPAGSATAVIANTLVSDNAGAGVSFSTPATGTGVLSSTVDHVLSLQNQNGFSLDVQNASSVNSKVMISNSAASHNIADGFSATASNPGGLTIFIDMSDLSSNGATGLAAGGTIGVGLSRSTITLNNLGVDSQVPANVDTAGNNLIAGNSSGNINPSGQPLVQGAIPLQ